MLFVCDPTIDPTGSSLQGTVKTTYAQLLTVFGEPCFTDADPREKVNCEWCLEFTDPNSDDVKIATIYNWKTGSIPTELYDWHVGGHSHEVVELVQDQINMLLKEEQLI